jgi:hypothetical protein
MTGDVADPKRVPRLDTGFFPTLNRRLFLKGVLAGASLAIAGAAGLPGSVIASPYAVSSGASPSQAGALDVARLKVASENNAKFTVTERDQTHELYNNLWADPNGPHSSMVAAQYSQNRFEAMATWDWPPWDKPYTHAYHQISHGQDWITSQLNTDSRFPFPISRYQSLTLDIPNVYVAGNGKWCLAFDMFMHKSIAEYQEIFIIIKRKNYATPPESGQLSFDGITYGYGKWSSESTNNIFWRKDNPAVPFRQQINMYDFINFLKSKGIVQGTDIIPGIYLGSEPIEGSGIWRIDSFYTTLAT